MSARLLNPPNALARLLDRPGGMARDHAIAAAAGRVEDLRGAAMAALRQTLCDMAQTGNGADLRRQADRMVTLCGFYGLQDTAEAARRLCDLLTLFAQKAIWHAEAVAVHLRALQLLLPDPGHPPPRDENAARMLAELEKIARHWRPG